MNPEKEKVVLEVHKTKKITEKVTVDMVSAERTIREMLANKIAGTFCGLWFLVAEHLRIGTWDLLKGWTGNNQLDMRVGMQVINEASLCVNGGLRPRKTLCRQGFEILSGLPDISTDKQIHLLLDKHTIKEAEEVQIVLAKIRRASGDYKGRVLALDPHRIEAFTERIMPKRRTSNHDSTKKMIQTFFCLDAETRQPVLFKIGGCGHPITRATKGLAEMVKQVFPEKVLYISDKEHFGRELTEYFSTDNKHDILVPVPATQKTKTLLKKLDYKEIWPGYAIAEGVYRFSENNTEVRFLGQRFCEIASEYNYNGFATTAESSALELLSEIYPKRWGIEEFFNFEGALGWKKASTMNLNIRYGKMTLALIAQAAGNNFRKKLSSPYNQWTVEHMAESIFSALDGDIRVKDDTIIVTIYNLPDELNLKQRYEHLPRILEAENICPKIPWLFDYKLDFRFK